MWLATAALALPGPAGAQPLQAYVVAGDAIPASLTGAPGDAVRGRALVLNRTSTCILCHSGPFPEEKFQGDLAPDLAGSGRRWSEGQLRLRIVDASRLNRYGGAIALGHPLGGSGTKLMTTLVNALRQRNKRYGLQTMCEGGGMANVTIVERL